MQSTFFDSAQNLQNLKIDSLAKYREANAVGNISQAIDSLIVHYSCSSVIPKVEAMHEFQEIVSALPEVAKNKIQNAFSCAPQLDEEIIRALQKAKRPISLSILMKRMSGRSRDEVYGALQRMISDPKSVVESFCKQRYRIKSYANKALRNKKVFTREDILSYLNGRNMPVRLCQVISDLGAVVYQETYNVRNVMARLLIEEKVEKTRIGWYQIANRTPTPSNMQTGNVYTSSMVLDFVRETQRPVLMREIVAALGAKTKDEVDAARNLISRMFADGKLSRRGYGLYADGTLETTFVPRVYRIQEILRADPTKQFSLTEITNILLREENGLTDQQMMNRVTAIKRTISRLSYRTNSGVVRCGLEMYRAKE